MSPTNSAFESARAEGVIDTFLSMPSPEHLRAEKYDWVRRNTMDAESAEMTMPAEYMFTAAPSYEEVDDPVALVLAQMDHYGIERMLVGWGESEASRRALTDHGGRFFGMSSPDPNKGMDGVRRLEREVLDHGCIAAHVWGAGLVPQVPINDKKMYPIYAKCVELDIPIVLYAGVPGPRLPMHPLDVARVDEVCWFFPELRIVLRHGAEPWTDLAVKLMLKWPNLYYSTSAFAPKYYPDDIVNFANTRGTDKIMFAGYYSAGLGLDRIFAELPDVPFRDHVWPKFLRENALRVFKLDA
jgi:predicted TIM-barrel fold metal-dependent hydrolase